MKLMDHCPPPKFFQTILDYLTNPRKLLYECQVKNHCFKLSQKLDDTLEQEPKITGKWYIPKFFGGKR